MVWSVCLLGEGVDGVTQRIDLLALGAIPSPNDIDEIGVTQTTGRRLLSELQQAVVALQEAALRAAAKERTATTSDLTLKDYRLRKVQTLFGPVSLRVPRLVNQGRIESVLPTSCGARSAREFDDLRNKLSAWMSFRSAMALLGEMYPVEDGKSAQTAMRQRERVMKKFKSPGHLQQFLSIHDPIANLFYLPRHEMPSTGFLEMRSLAIQTWRDITQVEAV
jgi:hypothetical protein